MKKSLQKKLMKYSLTAAAVVAAGASANAQVQYSGLVDASITNSYNLDLNGDGTDDFTLYVSRYSSTFMNTYQYTTTTIISTPSGTTVSTHTFTNTYTYSYNSKYASLNLKNSNEWMKSTNNLVKPMSSGQIVSESKTWSDNHWAGMGNSSFGSLKPDSFFIGQGDKYIGVKLIVSTDTLYGWVRVNIPALTDNLVVRDWAFEQTANKPIKTGQTVGISEQISDDLNITFGPNPTSGYLKISADDNYKVEILDMAGKIITETQMTNNTAELDLSNQQTGVYIARLTNDNITKTVKIVKQ